MKNNIHPNTNETMGSDSDSEVLCPLWDEEYVSSRPSWKTYVSSLETVYESVTSYESTTSAFD